MKTKNQILASKNYVCDFEGARCYYSDHVDEAMDEYANQFKVELPSDEEIEAWSEELIDNDEVAEQHEARVIGAKWLRNLIKSRQEENK